MSEVVTYESDGRVALVTINRPEKRNALNNAVVEGLHAAWQRYAAGPERTAILTGAGTQAFSGGADLDDFPAELWRAMPGVGVVLDKPVIAATAGWCVGGAAVLVAMCDLCIAAENTLFSYPEAKVGYCGGIIAALAVRIPHKVAMEFVLMGRPMSAERMREAGFVNLVVPAGEQVRVAREWAAELADRAPLVVGLLKNFISEVLPRGPAERAGAARAALDQVNGSDDAREGAAAFREKRKPVFRGR
jgi:enoyl-CoA hydratase/carnithine racemase